MTTYTVHLDQVGREHDLDPVTFEDVTHANELAALVCQRVKPYLRSRFIDVYVDMEEMRGEIMVGGWRPVGRFRVEEVPA